MKKLLALALALAMLGAAFVGCTPATNSGDVAEGGENVIRIGVFEPLTGDSASGGKKELLGVQYANAETPTVTLDGVEYKVEVVYSDNGSTTDKAPSAAATLVDKDVSIVLGSYGSGVSMAASDTFNQAGLAAMGITCTNPNVTKGNEHYFRICFLDPFQGSVLANFAKEKFGAKKAYLLGELGNEYDQGLLTFFEQTFTAAGGEVVKADFPTNTADFTQYLNTAKAEGCDVIFTPVSIAYATQIVSQAARLGIGLPILGSDTLDDNKVLEAAKGTDTQLFVSTFYQEGGSAAFDEGIKNYINTNADAKTANGGDDTISAVTAMGYDAYYVALEAIKAAGSADKAAVKAALPNVKYSGVSGEIAFDEIGDAIRDTAYIKTVDTAAGTWKLETVQKAN
ncbi:MAG: ABC transporter substrate-binding protein [Clostridia bacterium]|nr:ABC transporter substrate-binding protein [Clostridia bacterium]